MKQCTKCKEWKDESEFAKNSKAKDGLCHRCKACQKEYRKQHKEHMREYCKNYYLENRDTIRTNVKRNYESNRSNIIKYKDTYYRERIEWLDSIKTPCVKCGESRPWVIQFHHINPLNKSFCISQQHSKTKEEVLSEVEKCVCLCANCHKEFHFIYGTQPANPIDDLNEYLEGDF